MGPTLKTIIMLTVGAVITINGISAKADDILASASRATNATNVHQLSVAAELYYLDYGAYPKARDEAEFIDILASEKYIKNRPEDPAVFFYQTTTDGNDYDLSIR